jgi:hypothetical protein
MALIILNYFTHSPSCVPKMTKKYLKNSDGFHNLLLERIRRFKEMQQFGVIHFQQHSSNFTGDSGGLGLDLWEQVLR